MDKFKRVCVNCTHRKKSNREFPCNRCINGSKFNNKHISCYNCKHELKGYHNINCFGCGIEHLNFDLKDSKR